MFGTDLAIDLGTAQFKMYRPGKGVIVNEPSIVAVNLESDRIMAVGNKAYEMIGRTASQVAVVGPMRRGSVSRLLHGRVHGTLLSASDSREPLDHATGGRYDSLYLNPSGETLPD